MSRAPTRTCSHEETVDPRTDLGWLLGTSYQRLVAECDKRLAAVGLTAAQYGVATILARNEARTSSELCHLMDYDPGAMTRLLQRLEAKAVIERIPDVSDRRTHTLALTEKGQLLHEQAQPMVNAVHDLMLEGLDADEAKRLAALLCRVVRNFS